MEKYLENLSKSLRFIGGYMSKEDYGKLCAEVNEFIANNETKPIGEQTKLFMEKYGPILELAKHKRLLNIDNNVFFLKIVTIFVIIVIPVVFLIWIGLML